MTKEEILEKYYRNYEERIASEDHVLLAMEEYADQKAELLLKACEEFVRKVDCGEARSKRSYTEMKEAIAKFKRS